ncbi:MAG: hypothetical protein QM765_24970 [Myxococcales bacterium]
METKGGRLEEVSEVTFHPDGTRTVAFSDGTKVTLKASYPGHASPPSIRPEAEQP